MTDVFVTRADTLLALDLWDPSDPTLGDIVLPGPGRSAGTVLRTGPRRWWFDGGFTPTEIAAVAGGRGAVTAIGGGWLRMRLVGDWRDLIMQSGLIDADTPVFGPGCVAVTPLCHAPCVVHVRGDATCDVFVAASYANHCLAQWRALGWQQGVTG